ncbi:MAG: hypothetical protein R2684_09075 [Pyrinomonadaceae bacterium]
MQPDGKPLFAGFRYSGATVFRPSTNTWFSNQTTNGVVITPFGAAGDQPVAGL